MDNEKKISKSRKVTGIVLSTVLFAATLVGAGFGYAKTADSIGGVDTSFNDYAQIEAKVKFSNRDLDINDAAASITRTLDFLGMQNATVETAGSNRVIITNPISSFSTAGTKGDYNITNNKEDHFNTMADNNSQYMTEIMTLALPLFYDGTLDVRDTEGDVAFQQTENNGVKYWEFEGGVNDGGSFGVAESTDTASYSMPITAYSNPFDDYVAPTDFFDGATLRHSSGIPVIDLQIAKKGKSGDEYINMFKDLDKYLDENTDTEYVIWFNYDFTYRMVKLLDSAGLSDASDSLLDYVNGKENLRPLYLTASTGSLMSSKFSDTIEIKGGFNEQQAQYFVNKINNSGSFQYSEPEFLVITNLQTKIMLITLAALLLAIIIITIFLFASYFGLLGLIASAVFVISTMTMGLVFASTGILVTGLGLIALGVITLITAMIIWTVVGIYKSGNEDKFYSVSKVAINKFKKMHSVMFSPIVAIVLLFYGAGLVVTPLIATPLYLVVIGTSLSYLFATVIMFPIMYGMDLLLKFTRIEYNTNWDLLIGKINTSTKDVKESNGKAPMIGIIISLVIMAITIIVGGTLYGITGSVVNSNVFGTQDYVYQVQVVNETAKLTLNDISSLDGTYQFGNESFEYAFDQTNNNSGSIKSAFNDNGIKASKVQVVRYDEIGVQPDGTKVPIGAFGYQVYSKDAIDATKVDAINNELKDNEVQVINDNETNVVKTTFEVVEGGSYINGESMKVTSYINNVASIKGIYALLIMIFVITLILLFIGNWGVALAGLVSSLLSSTLLFAPMVILFIPFTSIVVFPTILISGVLLGSMAVITNIAKADEIDTNKWGRASNKVKYILPAFIGIMMFLEIFLIGTYSLLAVLSMVILTALAIVTVYMTQQLIFPFLAEMFGGYRDSKVESRLKKDIAASKNKKDGEISEEYIEGVNM